MLSNVEWGPVATVLVCLVGYAQFRSTRKTARIENERQLAAKKAEDDRIAEARDREADRSDRAQELSEFTALNDRLRTALEDAETAATKAKEASQTAEQRYSDLKSAYDEIVRRLTQIERDLSASKDENAVLRNLIEVAVEHLAVLEAALAKNGDVPPRPQILTAYLEDQRRTRLGESYAEDQERAQ